jgi:lipid-A-disaccharide synthase
MSAPSPPARPILILAQGLAGDRLGAALTPALRRRFPDRALDGIGGPEMAGAGVRLFGRSDRISAIGVTGMIPELPHISRLVLGLSFLTLKRRPACVLAIDIWQPLRVMHRFAPHLARLPHVCYLPPGPNFIGRTRVHAAAARRFAALITPFPHQAALYREAGAHVRLAAHAGLERCRRDTGPQPACPAARESILALLPGSRKAEVRYGLPVQADAARLIQERHPELSPVVCCASREVERAVQQRLPALAATQDTRGVLARARFALLCSGTATLEAAVLGCPGVATYHGSPLQRWEGYTFHVRRLERLRAAGVASPYLVMPNILLGEEVYPERIDAGAESVAAAALRELERDPQEVAATLRRVRDALAWGDAGEAVADEIARVLDRGAPAPGGEAVGRF